MSSLSSQPSVSFDALELIEPLRRALRDSGYDEPTPIQHQSIPPLLAGRDLLGCAQTGTGKTAAFALPIIQRLHGSPRRGKAPRALILSPTRELALQISDSFLTYGRHASLSVTAIFGGVNQFHQVKALRRGVDVLVATPGRLLDLMEQKEVDLSKVEVFVLDEADRMLDMGFIQPVKRIAGAVPTPRQTLLFSATMPKEVAHLAESLLRDPVRVAVTPVASAAPKIRQTVYLVPTSNKIDLLEQLLHGEPIERALVFVRTKHGADKLCRRLEKSGFKAGAIHGNKAQNARQRALEAFRNGRVPILVATDVAARGIDVDDISHVFNFDLPFEPEAYVHRIGRTGRAGAEGVAIAFCGREELALLRQIERLTGAPIARAEGSDASLESGPIEDAPRPRGGPRGQGGGRGRGGSRWRGDSRGAARGAAHGKPHGKAHGRGKRGAHAGDATARSGGSSSHSHASPSGAHHSTHRPKSNDHRGRVEHPAAGAVATNAPPRRSSGWHRPLKRR